MPSFENQTNDPAAFGLRPGRRPATVAHTSTGAPSTPVSSKRGVAPCRNSRSRGYPGRGATGWPIRRGWRARRPTTWPRPSSPPSPACAAPAWRRRSRRPGRSRWCCGRPCWAARPAASRRRSLRCAGCSARSRTRYARTMTSAAAVMLCEPSWPASGPNAGGPNAFTPPSWAWFHRPCHRNPRPTMILSRPGSWSRKPRSRRWAMRFPPTRAASSCGATGRRTGRLHWAARSRGVTRAAASARAGWRRGTPAKSRSSDARTARRGGWRDLRSASSAHSIPSGWRSSYRAAKTAWRRVCFFPGPMRRLTVR